MRTFVAGLALILVSAGVAGGVKAATPPRAPAPIHPFGIYSEDKMAEHGFFHVAWRTAGAQRWNEAGRLGFDHYFRSRTLNLGPAIPAKRAIEIRLRQEGGMAAQLDQIRWGGNLPKGLGKVEQQKLQAHDKDVIVASGRTFTYRFDAAEQPVLTVAARVEPPKIPHYQFNFPIANRLLPMESGWEPMRYTLGDDQHALRVDGKLQETRGRAPFFEDLRESGTGHGMDKVFGWVSNDEKNLFVAFDFLIDNTIEDDFAPGVQDYAKVYVRHGDGPTDWQEFKVMDDAKKWGRAAFTYSDRAKHEHRTYELAIPLREIEALRKNPSGKDLQLAFGLFGSASEGSHTMKAHYLTGHRKYLASYLKVQSGDWKTMPYARMISEDGVPMGNEIRLAHSVYNGGTSGEFIDSAYDPANERSMVVWGGYGQSIYARLVYPNGTTGASVTLATQAAMQFRSVKMTYGTVSAYPFLVAFMEASQIYTLQVSANGVTAQTIHAIPKAIAGFQGAYALAYDPGEGGYMIIWTEGGNLWARRLTNAGDVTGSVMLLATGNFSQLDLAYDAPNQRFLVTWYDWTSANLYGRLLTSATETTGPTVQLGAFSSYGIKYHPLRSAYTVAGNLGSNVVVRSLNSELAAYGTDATTPGPTYFTYVNAAVHPISGEALVTFGGHNGAAVFDFYSMLAGTPAAAPSTDSINFGSIAIDGSAQESFTVSNDGDTQSLLLISNVTVSSPFAIAVDGCSGASLESGESCNVTVTAQPAAPGAIAGTVTLLTNERAGSNSVPLTATAYWNKPVMNVSDPVAPFNDKSLHFGALPPGDSLVRYVTLTSVGAISLAITSVTAAGVPSAFSVDGTDCAGSLLATTASCGIQVTFAPASEGEFNGTITIVSNAGNPVAVTISGSAAEDAPPAPTLTAPGLVAPADGAKDVGQPVKFVFKKGLASDGGNVTHTLFVCDNKAFKGCEGEPQKAAGSAWLWLVLPGLVVLTRRKTAMSLLFIAALGSCTGGDGTGKADQRSVGVEEVGDLKANTAYYWKVVAKDQSGQEKASDVWSFTTK